MANDGVHRDFNTANGQGDTDNSQFTVSPLSPNDWQAYRDYYKGLSDPHHFSGFLKGRDLGASETYANLFDHTINNGSHVMFGMWHGDRLVGQTSIGFFDKDGKKTALLAGSEIADDYRGRRLVNKFYDARMQYLRDIGFAGEITTTIRPENTSSQKAAVRNGFVDTGRRDEHGYMIFTPADRSATTPTSSVASRPGGYGMT